MQVVNLGSINIDHVDEVEHFVRPGETLREAGADPITPSLLPLANMLPAAPA